MNVNQLESNMLDYNNLYFNLENGDVCLTTKYFYKQSDYTEFIKHIIQVTNNSVKIKKAVFNQDTFNIYIDMKETKLKNFDQDFLKQLIKFLEDTYPDTVDRMYFRNVPIMFKSAWVLIRPFIGRDTRKKIIFEKAVKQKALNSQNDVKIIQITEDNLDELF